MSPAAARLGVSRCYNHPDREASARCTVCGRFHCRECVAEHDGRMICGACLRKERPRDAVGEGRVLRRAVLSARVVAAGIATWFGLYLLGRLMLDVPSEFHEGTVWKGEWWQADDK